MHICQCEGLVVHAPEFFSDPAFLDWLNDGRPKFTWHQGGEAGEWSDVIILVDPSLSGDGSETDMPAHIWQRILAICRGAFAAARGPESHIMVRLTNLAG